MSPGERLAQGLSYAVNPFILSPALLLLTLHYFGAPGTELLRVGVIAVVCFTLLPLGYLLWLVRTRQATSVDVPRRRQRVRPIAGGMLFSLLGFMALFPVIRTARLLVLALLGLHLFHLLLLLLITERWKISIHLFSLSAFNAALLALELYAWPYPALPGTLLPWWLLSLLLIPLLMWARVRLRVHTVAQVLGGFLLGEVLPFVELYLLHRLLYPGT